MSWVSPTLANFAIDQAATSQDILEVIHSLISVKEMPKRISFGGDPGYLYTNTAYQSLIYPIFNEIDGTNLGGLAFELHFMVHVLGGDTVTVQLWDRTSSASRIEVTSSLGTLAMVKSGPITIVPSVQELEVRVKSSGTSGYHVYGPNLVQK